MHVRLIIWTRESVFILQVIKNHIKYMTHWSFKVKARSCCVHLITWCYVQTLYYTCFHVINQYRSCSPRLQAYLISGIGSWSKEQGPLAVLQLLNVNWIKPISIGCRWCVSGVLQLPMSRQPDKSLKFRLNKGLLPRCNLVLNVLTTKGISSIPIITQL